MSRIKFIKQVFQELNDQSINYCILRNYDFLIQEREPSHQSEYGIDMVVSKHDFTKFKQTLQSLTFIIAKQSFSKKHFNFIALTNQKLVSLDVQIGGVHWNDICYLSEEKILGDKVKKSFLHVPSDQNTVVMLTIHSILGKRKFKPEYKEIIIKLLPNVDLDYIKSEITKILGKNNTKEIVDLLQKQNFEKILDKKYSYILYFILKFPRNTAIFTKLFFLWLKWKKLFAAYPLISVVGPDGSGKSSLTKELVKFLKQQNRKVAFVYNGRGRNHILPITKIGYRYKIKEIKKDEKSKIKASKNKKSAYRNILYTLTAPVFTLDLLLRYLARILPQRHKRRLVVTDRYCSDIILMKNVPFWFKRILLSIFPKPTISIYLYNEAEILHQRRPEEKVSELQRQMDIFNKFNYSLKVRTTNQQQNTEDILKFVLFKLYKKGF